MFSIENCSMCSLVRLYGHSNTILSVVFSPNGEYLASGSTDETINIRSVYSGEIIKTLRYHNLSIR